MACAPKVSPAVSTSPHKQGTVRRPQGRAAEGPWAGGGARAPGEIAGPVMSPESQQRVNREMKAS